VDADGYILTNAHVVKNFDQIQVRLFRAQHTEMAARLVHHNKELDLALIQLMGEGPFPKALLGPSNAVGIGQWVVAVGSPYGLAHSASMGIVSDHVSSLWIDGTLYKDLIQTDAAINQGNSGGPLINLDGEVIGINTAIYAPSGIFAGVGFAISIERAVDYIHSLLPQHSLGHVAVQKKPQKFEKEPIRPGAKPPHPQMGNCLNCHTFITNKNNPPKDTLQLHTVAAQIPAQSSASNQPASLLPSMGKPGEQNALQWILNLCLDWSVICRAAAFVLAAAVLFNMLGLGGGFFYVPILLLFGVDFHVASATSLFIIAASHLSSIYIFSRSHLIDYELALILEPVTCLGALLGGLYSNMFGETTLSFMFGACTILASYLIYRDPAQQASGGQPYRLFTPYVWQRSFGTYEYAIDIPIAMPIAFVIGYMGSMLGFAGGVIKIPMLVLLFGVPLKIAIATSSLMVAITSSMGCVGHGFAGHFDPLLSIVLATLAVIGGYIGASFTIKADRAMLKRLFSAVLLMLSIWMIYRVI